MLYLSDSRCPFVAIRCSGDDREYERKERKGLAPFAAERSLFNTGGKNQMGFNTNSDRLLRPGISQRASCLWGKASLLSPSCLAIYGRLRMYAFVAVPILHMHSIDSERDEVTDKTVWDR